MEMLKKLCVRSMSAFKASAMIGLACATHFASAATWNGGGESNVWSASANWDILPVNGDALTFGGALKTTNTNDLLSSVGAVAFSTAGWIIRGSAVTLAGNMTHTTANGTIEWGVDTALGATRTFSVGGGKTIVLSGQLSGAGGLASSAGYSYAGVIRISGTNNLFIGAVSTDSAIVEVTRLANGGQPSSLGQGTSDITVGSAITGAPGTLKYVGYGDVSTDRKIKTLNWAANGASLYNNSPDHGSLRFTSKGTWYLGWRDNDAPLKLYGTSKGTNVIDGILGNSSYTAGKKTSLLIDTAGAWALNGTNTFSGSTTVNKGILFVNGMLSGVGTVGVAAGGTLAGMGAITGAVNIATGASFAPGTGTVGTMNLCSNLTFSAGATNLIAVMGKASGQYSSVRVTGGDVTLANAVLVIDPTGYQYSGLGMITIIDVVTPGKTVTGTFANQAEGARIKTGALLCTISYVGGDGNDVVLNIVPRGTCISMY